MSLPETHQAVTTEESRREADRRQIHMPDQAAVSHGHFNALATMNANTRIREAGSVAKAFGGTTTRIVAEPLRAA